MFSIFCPSKLHSNLCFGRMSKTSRKSMILASQKLAKTHPKTTQNRFPQKNAVWHRCLFDLFCFFNLRFLKNMHFTYVKSPILQISLKSCFCRLNACSVQKPRKNPSKTKCETSKNRCWKHLVFQHRFFHVLGSILEPPWLPRLNQVRHFGLKKLGTVLLLSLLKSSVF